MNVRDLSDTQIIQLDYWLMLQDVELDFVLMTAVYAGTTNDFALTIFREHAERHTLEELREDLAIIAEEDLGFIQDYPRTAKGVLLAYMGAQWVVSIDLAKFALDECNSIDHNRLRGRLWAVTKSEKWRPYAHHTKQH